MWIKYFSDGSKIVEDNTHGKTWLKTPLDNMVRADLVLPQHLFGNVNRFTLKGPGPYHQAIKARSSIGGRTFKIAEYLQRFDGKAWLTIEANFLTGKIRQYISPKRIGG